MSKRKKCLRPHHLFCLYYQIDFPERGRDFIKAISEIKQCIRKKQEVSFELAQGPDEVCNVCPAFNGKGCGHPDGDEQEVSKWDHILLKTFNLSYGDSLTAAQVKKILEKDYPIPLCKRCRLPSKKLCSPPKKQVDDTD